MAECKKMLDIVVVGGSLGGLFTAIAFKRLGHHVKILERTPLLHNQGAGIVAGGPTQDFFHKYDRTKTPLAVTSHLRQYLNKEGDVIDEEGMAQQMTSWDLLYNILRRNYDGAGDDSYFTKAKNDDAHNAEAADGTGEYLTGHKVTKLTDAGEGVDVVYQKDGQDEHLQADLVIGADGPSSTIRSLLQADVKRTHAGYVAWRGTVLESDVSDSTRQCFAEKFTFFHSHGLQILSYAIPGPNGSLQPGNRLLNYVWYCNYLPDSDDFKTLMTDEEGTLHRWTLPAGKVSPAVWENQQAHASRVLPPQFAELVQRTKIPFVQVVTDVLPAKALHMGGKVVLVGDALCGLRPHTAASTSQAAMHAMKLGEAFEKSGGKKEDLQAWAKEVEEWGAWMSKRGRVMGDRSQFGEHPLADDRKNDAKSC